jgi:hypothetical protein
MNFSDQHPKKQSTLVHYARRANFRIADNTGAIGEPSAVDRDLSWGPLRKRTIAEVYRIFEDLPM